MRRGRGDGTGTEDGEVWWGRVRMQAGDGHAVTARRAVTMAEVVGLQAGQSWRWFMSLCHIRARHPLLKQLGWASPMPNEQKMWVRLWPKILPRRCFILGLLRPISQGDRHDIRNGYSSEEETMADPCGGCQQALAIHPFHGLAEGGDGRMYYVHCRPPLQTIYGSCTSCPWHKLGLMIPRYCPQCGYPTRVLLREKTH
jgi:hypothetical protein